MNTKKNAEKFNVQTTAKPLHLELKEILDKKLLEYFSIKIDPQIKKLN